MTLTPADLISPEFMRNPHPEYSRLRALGPVFKTTLPWVGEVWTTTTYEAATRVLRDKEDFCVDPANAGKKGRAGMKWWMPRMLTAMANNMLGKDEPDHRRLRRLVEGAFMQQSIDEMRPRLQTLVEQQLDILKQAAAKEGVVDFQRHFARPFPINVISELLGLPEADRPMIARLSEGITSINSAFGILKFIPTLWRLTRYIQKQIDICRRQPRLGMLSDLVRAEQEGDKLSKTELLAATLLLFLAGHETTVHLLDGAVVSLLQHPEAKQELLADWSLSYSAVGEVLRHFGSIYTTKPRYARRDLDFFGVTIPKGEFCMPLLGAANVDPAVFDEPEKFDIRRNPSKQLGFGTGMHICLGQKLAWAEVEIALQGLFTQFPNLQLAQPYEQLHWRERIGSRALLGLPLKLNTD